MTAAARRVLWAAVPVAAALCSAAAPGRHAAAQGDAAAAAAACAAAVERAVRAIGEAERFHSRLLARTPGRRRPVEEERFVIGDVVYANSPASGRWVKLPMTANDRLSLSAAIAAHPPRDCRDEGAGQVDGAAARIYSYRQELPPHDGGSGGAGSVALGRLWVAEADGRPRRYEGQHKDVRVALTFDYDAVAPPFGK